MLLPFLLALGCGVGEGGFSWPACQSGRMCDNDIQPLGCFEQGSDTPWCHLPVSYIQPQFWFVSPDGRRQIINFFSLQLSLATLREVDPSRELFVIIHGFGSGWPRGYVFPMAHQLNLAVTHPHLRLQGNKVVEGHNAIAVDWERGSADPNYFQAASNTRIMGAIIARLVNQLCDIRGYSAGKITLVGFSLGSHVAGFAGARIKGLKRIIGLDPAGPLYATNDPFTMGMSPETRLNQSDALLVQCIHTDGLSLPNGGAGTTQSFGHIDFFPNGGQIQPGCGAPIPVAVNDLIHFLHLLRQSPCTCCPHP